jgi:hypothetical protein
VRKVRSQDASSLADLIRRGISGTITRAQYLARHGTGVAVAPAVRPGWPTWQVLERALFACGRWLAPEVLSAVLGREHSVGSPAQITTRCTTVQHVAPQCNTLHHSAARCNTRASWCCVKSTLSTLMSKYFDLDELARVSTAIRSPGPPCFSPLPFATLSVRPSVGHKAHGGHATTHLCTHAPPYCRRRPARSRTRCKEVHHVATK